MSRQSRHWAGVPRRQWRAIRTAVLDRDGWRCQHCGRAGRLEVDHVTPLDHGGAMLDPSNLQALCRGCHIAKTRGERPAPPADVLAWREYLDKERDGNVV